MDELVSYLKKKSLVYRKSYKYYSKWHVGFTLTKVVSASSGLAALSGVLPLAALSLLGIVVEAIEKGMKITDKKNEFKMAYKHYVSLLNFVKKLLITSFDLISGKIVLFQNCADDSCKVLSNKNIHITTAPEETLVSAAVEATTAAPRLSTLQEQCRACP